MYFGSEKTNNMTGFKKKGPEENNRSPSYSMACKVGNSTMLGLVDATAKGVVQRLRLLDSQALDRNLGKSGKKDMQAHHIIPNEIVVESINANLRLDLGKVKARFDSKWNGIYLPAIEHGGDELPVHGANSADETRLANSHDNYTEAVRTFIGGDLASLVTDEKFAKNVADYFKAIILDMRTGDNVAEIDVLDDIGEYFDKENFDDDKGQTYSQYMVGMLSEYNLNDNARRQWANVHEDEGQSNRRATRGRATKRGANRQMETKRTTGKRRGDVGYVKGRDLRKVRSSRPISQAFVSMVN